MKILLIDDGGEKYATLIDYIMNGFDSSIQVDHAKSRIEALNFLKVNIYPIMLVDMYLPNMVSDIPLPDGGWKLIETIKFNNTLNKPWKVFAVTSQVDGCSEEISLKLSAEKIPLIQYSEDISQSQSLIFEQIEWMKEMESKFALIPTSFRTDYLIVTTLKAEYDAYDLYMDIIGKGHIPDGCIKMKYGYVLTELGLNQSVKVVQLKSQGPVSAAVGMTGCIYIFAPKHVILTGICGGVEGESKIGDLIIATEIIDYTKGKIIDNQGFTCFEPESPSLSIDVGHCESFFSGEKFESILSMIERKIEGDRPEKPPTLVFGQVASGNQVVGRSETINDIKSARFRKLKAIEMEAWGGIWACKNCGIIKPNFYFIKSVSDLSNEKKGDKYHGYCSKLSAGMAISSIRENCL